MTDVYVKLSDQLTVKVTLNREQEAQVTGPFLDELRRTIDQIAHRYAPNHREFLLELRERVLLGIEPSRLGRGGLVSFVDKVGYRMWDEHRREGRVSQLAHPSGVVPPPSTGEMRAVTDTAPEMC